MNKKILRLAIPNIITNLTVPILSSVDTALMGHLDHVYYLGAIAIGGMIFNVIYWGFGFLRMGTTGLTAQTFGNKDSREGFFLLLRALIVATGAGILLILLQKPIADLSFKLLHTSTEVEKNARIYFFIRIYAAPATLASYAFTGWFFGMQNARYPMYIAVLTNGLNIVLNITFLKVFGMKADGVALGTVCANYLGLIFTILLFYNKYGSFVNYGFRKQIFDLKQLSRFFSINRDIFIRTMLLVFAFSFFTAQSARFGDVILAVNSILINLWTVMSYGIDGFAFAAESIVGNYIGAKDKSGLRKAVKYSLYWGVGLGILISAIYVIFEDTIIRIFTDKTEVISGILKYYFWTACAPVINAFSYIWDGIFIGATAGLAIRNTMIISTLLIYLPVYYISVRYFGNHGLWMALSVFMIARGFSLGLLYNKHVYNQI